MLELRPSYSVLSKNEIKKLDKVAIRHWLSALYNCIDRYMLLTAYDEIEENK